MYAISAFEKYKGTVNFLKIADVSQKFIDKNDLKSIPHLTIFYKDSDSF